MRVLVQRLYANPNYNRVLAWGKLITITGSAQALIQALGLIGGILVIRLLPTKEYALYTLANTMLGTMVLLADGGITAGVMAQGGKVWQERERLGVVLATGLDLRKKFAIISFVIAIPILLYLLRHHGASWIMSILIVLSLFPAFFTALSSQLLEIIPKLQQDVTSLQKIQVGVNTGRLMILVLTIFVFPWAFVATSAVGLPQIWGNRRLAKVSEQYAIFGQKPDPIIRLEIIAFVKRLLPGVIYYCLSGQLTIWLISVFGSTTALAEVGALNRLAMVLGVINILFSTLISPRFARLPDISKLLFTRYIQIQIILVVICLIMVGFVWMFPEEILWILGSKYAGLRSEVVLSMIGSCLGLIAGSSFTLYINRGWAINPAISISFEIASIIVGACLINISSLRGVLLLNIFISATQVIMHMSFSFIKMYKLKA